MGTRSIRSHTSRAHTPTASRWLTTALVAGTAGLAAVGGFAPAAGATQSVAFPSTPSTGTKASSAGLASSASSANPALCSAPVLRGNIEGSAASPLLPQGNGPLADQLGVNPGATDATIMGNSGHTGPSTGGLRAVPTINGSSVSNFPGRSSSSGSCPVGTGS